MLPLPLPLPLLLLLLFCCPEPSPLDCPHPLVLILALDPRASLLLGQRKVVERGLGGGFQEDIVQGQRLVGRVAAGLCLRAIIGASVLMGGPVCDMISA